jgi:hypothetical protein
MQHKKGMGFSPCGMFFEPFVHRHAFFRSLFSRAATAVITTWALTPDGMLARKMDLFRAFLGLPPLLRHLDSFLANDAQSSRVLAQIDSSAGTILIFHL